MYSFTPDLGSLGNAALALMPPDQLMTMEQSLWAHVLMKIPCSSSLD